MKVEYYAVRKGKNTGLFTSWDTVRELTENYPNAEFKSFVDYNTAMSYLQETVYEEGIPDVYYAYVDGSNLGDGSKYSGSAVIVYNNEVVFEVSVFGDHPDFLPKRNIAGELMGALLAIQWAIENKIFQLYICHDYVGVGKWATGEFKARDQLAKMYKERIDVCIGAGMDLKFIKVDGHTGHVFNERADWLAKEVLGIAKKPFKLELKRAESWEDSGL